MASSNFVVSSLPSYVQDNKDILIKNFALVGTGTRTRIGIQTGVKGSAYLNYLELAPTLQDGSSCGFSASGSATITQKTAVTARIKVNMDVCPESLVGKYAEYLVRINATENDLPFEQYIVDGIISEVNKKIENLIWLGDTSATTDTNLKWIDGLIEQFKDDSDVVDVALTAGTTAYNAIKAVYMAMTEETLERGAEIYVSPSLFRSFVQALVEKNFFHYSGPQEAAPEEIFFPGTDVKVVKTQGLSGDAYHVVGTFPKNLVYVCDAEGDNEDIKVWFSDDDDEFKIKLLWNSGIAYHFGSEVVLGTIASE